MKANFGHMLSCCHFLHHSMERDNLQALSYIVSLNTAYLSLRNPASFGSSHGSCGAQDTDKRNALYQKLTNL